MGETPELVMLESAEPAPDGTKVGGMQPADVTAAPAEVVAEVLRDPATFLAVAAEAAPGWSTRYGGAEGVAQLTSALHEHLAGLTQRNSALRGVTVLYLYRQAKAQMPAIARLLGVTKGAVNHVIRRAEQDAGREWFRKLESPRGWKP